MHLRVKMVLLILPNLFQSRDLFRIGFRGAAKRGMSGGYRTSWSQRCLRPPAVEVKARDARDTDSIAAIIATKKYKKGRKDTDKETVYLPRLPRSHWHLFAELLISCDVLQVCAWAKIRNKVRLIIRRRKEGWLTSLKCSSFVRCFGPVTAFDTEWPT
jgi:hypothetical protein